MYTVVEFDYHRYSMMMMMKVKAGRLLKTEVVCVILVKDKIGV